MKKIYLIMALLFVFSLLAVTVTSVSLSLSSNATVIEEEILYGDKGAASGISVTAKSHLNYRLFWETKLKIGEKNSYKTDYSFSLFQKSITPKHKHSGTEITSGIEYGFDEYEASSKQEGISKAYKKLFDSTEEGETGLKTIYIKDYYDYYPLKLYFDLPNTAWAYEQWEEVGDKPFDPKYVGDKFRKYFKIPVKDTDKVEIEVSRYEDGKLYSSGMNESEVFNFYTVSTYTDKQCFFAINNRCYSKDNISYVDTSLIPGGYGIYAFNYGRSESEYHTGIDADSLTTLFSLKQEEIVRQMGVSEDNKKLFYFSEIGKATYFTVIDIKTLEQLQHFKVCDKYFSTANVNKDFIAAFAEENISVISYKNGVYSLALSVPSANSINNRLEAHWGEEAVAFKDGKLAIVNNTIHSKIGYKTCDFYVAVYDKNGLCYYGNYKNSLTEEQTGEYYNSISQPLDYEANIVNF